MNELPDLPSPAEPIHALVLAGGAGRRVGGRDKGLLSWQGKPLIEHVIARVAPQVHRLSISCNRNRETYAALAPLTPPDLRPDYQGPLAGLETAQQTVAVDYVLLAPCDTPLLPLDLVSRLHAELAHQPSSGACYARTGNSGHYLCALLRYSALSSLTDFLDRGERAVHLWYAEIGAVSVDFSAQRGAFLNLNALTSHSTPDES